MSVTVSYPGVYIEELPSSSHSVTPAPTSVTVFVGYTNPFWKVPAAATRPGPGGRALQLRRLRVRVRRLLLEPVPSGLRRPGGLPVLRERRLARVRRRDQADGLLRPATDPPTGSGVDRGATATLDDGTNGFVFDRAAVRRRRVADATAGLKMTATVSQPHRRRGLDGRDTADSRSSTARRSRPTAVWSITDVVATVNAASRLVSVAGLEPRRAHHTTA